MAGRRAPCGSALGSCDGSPATRPCRLASLLERHGFLGGRAWLAAWEDAWQRNLRSCSRDGQCHIQLT